MNQLKQLLTFQSRHLQGGIKGRLSCILKSMIPNQQIKSKSADCVEINDSKSVYQVEINDSKSVDQVDINDLKSVDCIEINDTKSVDQVEINN